MTRFFATLCVIMLCLLPLSLSAQGFSGLARVEVGKSQITDRWGGGVNVELMLSQGVPYRAYTLADPERLVLDFREVDWTGVEKQVLLNADNATDLRFGRFRPGWSRLVLDLAGPQVIETADLQVDENTGQAQLKIELVEADPEDFTKLSGAPYDPRWDLPQPVARAVAPATGDRGITRIVLDPGHGGIDPGAERAGYSEKELMLTFARELQETLIRSGGYEVFLTRDADHFVSLERRVAIAHEVDAHIFLSLHADALAEGYAQGATVYVLSETASDAASAKLAERHDRDDLLSGVDLTGQDDVVANILMDLARQETEPRTKRLAHTLVDTLRQTNAPMNRRPLREAGFSVLKAADIPSVLIEVGFMSSERDMKNLTNKQWRIAMAAGIRDALRAWARDDAALKDLVRH